jgi:tetratricopeptide (TPR) repeat protein
MKHVQNNTDTPSQLAPPSSDSKRRLVMIIVAALVLIGAIIGGWYLAVQNKDTASERPDRGYTYELTLEQLSEEDLQVRVNQFTFTGQFEQAEELIRYQDDFDTSSSLRRILAVVLINSGDTERAIEAFLGVAELGGMDQNIAENIGDLYAQQGDNQSAIEHYQLAIQLIETTDAPDPLDERNVRVLNRKIEELAS